MPIHPVNPPRRARAATAILILLLAFGCSSAPPAPQQESSAPPPAAAPYENLLVRRPGTQAEDGKVYLVRNGKKHWVIKATWFASNGYRFPHDVREISATELDSIPTGAPIE